MKYCILGRYLNIFINAVCDFKYYIILDYNSLCARVEVQTMLAVLLESVGRHGETISARES
jgi:hypothetical protein